MCLVKNIEKYYNNGWGLSKVCFLMLEKILNNFESPNIIEFGSGVSTEFFVDYLNETNKLSGKIYSFDNDIEYSSKIDDVKLELNVVDLVECNDISFNIMFKMKRYDKKLMIIRSETPNTRQKNCFYNITEANLPDYCDVCVLDGPHGNGRSISFLHLKNKLKSGSYVIIDDYTHYDFSDKFRLIFPKSDLVFESKSGKLNQWELGGDFRIYKIL